MGPIWGRHDPGGPHVGPMNFVFRVRIYITVVGYMISRTQDICDMFYTEVICYKAIVLPATAQYMIKIGLRICGNIWGNKLPEGIAWLIYVCIDQIIRSKDSSYLLFPDSHLLQTMIENCSSVDVVTVGNFNVQQSKRVYFLIIKSSYPFR